MPHPRPQPGPRYAALLQLLRTADTLWNASHAFFARWNLGPSQFNLLNLLVDSPAGATQTELSQALIVHRSNVTGLVDRLAARGLVERRTVRGDRRAHRVVLTPAGRALMNDLLPHYYRAAEEVWGPLPLSEVRRAAVVLSRLTQQALRLASRPPSSPP